MKKLDGVFEVSIKNDDGSFTPIGMGAGLEYEEVDRFKPKTEDAILSGSCSGSFTLLPKDSNKLKRFMRKMYFKQWLNTFKLLKK